jgi:hypothetical protein
MHEVQKVLVDIAEQLLGSLSQDYQKDFIDYYCPSVEEYDALIAYVDPASLDSITLANTILGTMDEEELEETVADYCRGADEYLQASVADLLYKLGFLRRKKRDAPSEPTEDEKMRTLLLAMLNFDDNAHAHVFSQVCRFEEEAVVEGRRQMKAKSVSKDDQVLKRLIQLLKNSDK